MFPVIFERAVSGSSCSGGLRCRFCFGIGRNLFGQSFSEIALYTLITICFDEGCAVFLVNLPLPFHASKVLLIWIKALRTAV